MDWKQILLDAGLPVTWAEMREGRVEAGFDRPLTQAEAGKFLQIVDPPAARRAAAEAGAMLATELKSVSGEQAVAWIESNVTSLATAKTALKVLVRVVVALRDEVFPRLPDL